MPPQDLREAKLKLHSAIEVVESERDRLKGYQVDISSSCIDDYLVESSDGALSGLMAFRNSDHFSRLSEEEQYERTNAADEVKLCSTSISIRY